MKIESMLLSGFENLFFVASKRRTLARGNTYKLALSLNNFFPSRQRDLSLSGLEIRCTVLQLYGRPALNRNRKKPTTLDDLMVLSLAHADIFCTVPFYLSII